MTEQTSSDSFHEEQQKGKINKWGKAVLAALKQDGAMTQGETWMAIIASENKPSLDRNCISPRFAELKREGKIHALIKKRPCRITGKTVNVYSIGPSPEGQREQKLKPSEKIEALKTAVALLRGALLPMRRASDAVKSTAPLYQIVGGITVEECRDAAKVLEATFGL